MRSSRTKNFKKLFIALPQRVKETAKKNYALWQENLFHPSLEFKEIKSKGNIWSVRVGIGWRALGVVKAKLARSLARQRVVGVPPIVATVEGAPFGDAGSLVNEDKIVWFWIGSHAEYDKILRKK